MKKNRREEREGHIGSATLAVTVTTNSHAPSNNGYSAPVLFQPNTHTHTQIYIPIHLVVMLVEVMTSIGSHCDQLTIGTASTLCVLL